MRWRRNASALPESLDYRMNRQQILTERLAQFSRDRSLLEDQRTQLQELRESGMTAAEIAADWLRQQAPEGDIDTALALAGQGMTLHGDDALFIAPGGADRPDERRVWALSRPVKVHRNTAALLPWLGSVAPSFAT